MKVLHSRTALRRRIGEMGREITAHFRGRNLTVVGILNGSFVFMSDLIRQIDLPLECDFVRISSYGSGTVSSGKPRFLLDTSRPVRGRDILLVDDIVDTGHTLSMLASRIRKQSPRSVRTCALLHKPSRRVRKVKIDWLGFTVPDVFVVGYGLDQAERHRNLPYLGKVVST